MFNTKGQKIGWQGSGGTNEAHKKKELQESPPLHFKLLKDTAVEASTVVTPEWQPLGKSLFIFLFLVF